MSYQTDNPQFKSIHSLEVGSRITSLFFGPQAGMYLKGSLLERQFEICQLGFTVLRDLKPTGSDIISNADSL